MAFFHVATFGNVRSANSQIFDEGPIYCDVFQSAFVESSPYFLLLTMDPRDTQSDLADEWMKFGRDV